MPLRNSKLHTQRWTQNGLRLECNSTWSHKTSRRKQRINFLTYISAIIFWIWHQKATKAKIREAALYQKASVQQRKPSAKWKGNLLNGRKYLQIIYLNKGLLPRIYKELIQLNSKNTIWWKNGRETDIFPKKKCRWPKDTRNDNSTSLITRETEIKTTMRYYLTPIRMAIIKKTKYKPWQGFGEKGSLIHS